MGQSYCLHEFSKVFIIDFRKKSSHKLLPKQKQMYYLLQKGIRILHWYDPTTFSKEDV